jgi:hypothetical protein
MNGDQPTDEQKPPLASPAVSANGSNAGGKKRKKEGLKPIITIESGSQQQASGYVSLVSSFVWLFLPTPFLRCRAPPLDGPTPFFTPTQHAIADSLGSREDPLHT